MKTGAMVPRRQPKRFVLLCIGAFIVLLNGGSHAKSIITADGQLDRYHLAKEEPALLDYLESGIPQDFSGSFNERWDMYRCIAAKLGELGSEKASPTLIQLIEGPLPPPLHEDLLQTVARSLGHDSWGDWDDERARNLTKLRKACAWALAEIGIEDALPVLLSQLETLGQSVKRELEKEEPESSLIWSYSSVCRDVTALGSKAGIDALIATLDHLPQRAPETIVDYLRICTGQTFGPEYSQPLHLRPAEIQKWRDWWKQNRDTFYIDRQRILSTEKLDLPRPVPEALRDYVSEASDRYWDYDGSGHGRESVRWLEKHGEKYGAELGAIVNDRDEDTLVRKEALEWYARLAGDEARDLLVTYAAGDKTQSDTCIAGSYLQSEALSLLWDHFPRIAEDVTKRCMFSGHPVPSKAVDLLMKNAKNHTYVAENIARLGEPGRFQAIQLLLRLSEPVGRPAFFEGVKDPDVQIAAFAARGIRKFGLEGELPDSSRNALERWRIDPEFLLLLIEESTPKKDRVEAVNAALRRVRGTDADAARTYYRAWTMLPSNSRDAPLAGLMRCVEAYRKSRDLH